MIAYRRRHKTILGCFSLCRADLRCMQAAPRAKPESPAAAASLLERTQRDPRKFGRNRHRSIVRRAQENARCVGDGRCRRSIWNWRSKCIETARPIRSHTDLDLWPSAFLIAADRCSDKLRAKATTTIKPVTQGRHFLSKPRTKHHGFENIPHLDDALRPEFELCHGAYLRRRTKSSLRAFLMRTGRNRRSKATNVPAMAYLQV
jgi:hypothetical protein